MNWKPGAFVVMGEIMRITLTEKEKKILLGNG